MNLDGVFRIFLITDTINYDNYCEIKSLLAISSIVMPIFLWLIRALTLNRELRLLTCKYQIQATKKQLDS